MCYCTPSIRAIRCGRLECKPDVEEARDKIKQEVFAEDVIAFFGCYLIDNHEEKFNSEENIQKLCNEVLNAYSANQD